MVQSTFSCEHDRLAWLELNFCRELRDTSETRCFLFSVSASDDSDRRARQQLADTFGSHEGAHWKPIPHKFDEFFFFVTGCAGGFRSCVAPTVVPDMFVFFSCVYAVTGYQ